MGRTLTELVPTAKDQQVRGYRSTATWGQIFGMFDRLHHRVIMAELANAGTNGDSGLVSLNNPSARAGIVRHEFGHAVDEYLKGASHSAAFKAAYAAGLRRLDGGDKKVLNYYLQPGDAGREEMFAELFAAQAADACDPAADRLLRQKFPEALSMVSNISANGPVVRNK